MVEAETRENGALRGTSATPGAPRKSGPSRRVLLVGAAGYALAVAAVLVGLSGRPGWGMAWLYAAVAGVTTAVTVVRAPADRAFVEERTRLKADVKTWDKPLGIILSVAPLAVLVVAGLDRRFGWSPSLGLAVQAVALVLVLICQLGYAWTIASNRFYSRFVRIQKERGHTVVTGGPYRFVRHPGYATGLLSILASAPALGSLWALVPAGLITVLGMLRTVLEDRTLRAELPGYAAYARRVRYCLLPGVW